ncbi:hypothetical protein BaRGS_00012817 [Batillaria attramentaria]|uniref:Uncharacterized protein n=1 Tax=Batillaria attramentaria TaxID=370345 RepID=A0ABD0L8P0_9CAEN
MSLLAKLQAQKEEGRRQSMAVKDDPRRPSMASKSLAVPTGATQGPRRSSSVGLAGARAGSISTGGGPAGPSLLGLLASKRFAKKLTTRFFNRRMWGSSRLSGQGLPIQKEPSYRMEPHRKFHSGKVEELLKTVLEEKLEKFRYSPKICPNMCKILSDDIKEKVKQMNFDRYKIVCNVLIGQKKDQGVMTCSRCVWDEKLDNFASYSFQNEHIFCTATVFGVYTE